MGVFPKSDHLWDPNDPFDEVILIIRNERRGGSFCVRFTNLALLDLLG